MLSTILAILLTIIGVSLIIWSWVDFSIEFGRESMLQAAALGFVMVISVISAALTLGMLLTYS